MEVGVVWISYLLSWCRRLVEGCMSGWRATWRRFPPALYRLQLSLNLLPRILLSSAGATNLSVLLSLRFQFSPPRRDSPEKTYLNRPHSLEIIVLN